MAYLGFDSSSLHSHTKTPAEIPWRKIDFPFGSFMGWMVKNAVRERRRKGRDGRSVNAKQINIHTDKRTRLRQILVCLAGSLIFTQARKTFFRFEPKTERTTKQDHNFSMA
jgi:hypothetical protein